MKLDFFSPLDYDPGEDRNIKHEEAASENYDRTGHSVVQHNVRS